MKMDEADLKELLFSENEIERIQKKTGININDQNLIYTDVSIPEMPEKNFFTEGNIFINKHHRYSEMPAHTHEFVEFNYMYSGQCTQYVDDQKIHFQKGDILLMDRHSVQRISALGYDDILINILLKNESITTDILINMVETDGILSEFLLGKKKSDIKNQRHLHFHTSDNLPVQKLVEKIILDYYKKDKYYMKTINLELSILLIELTKIIDETNLSENSGDFQIVDILKYIEVNYNTVTLSKLAEVFGYNKNYLSDKLKKETGKSYKELVSYTRYKVAIELLRYTNYPLDKVAEKIGYDSIASLYKLLKKYTNKNVKEIKHNL